MLLYLELAFLSVVYLTVGNLAQFGIYLFIYLFIHLFNYLFIFQLLDLELAYLSAV